jgi:prepilin-type processing-associated H-X9-DG protein
MDTFDGGAFQFGSASVHFNDIGDGLSNTIMVGEKNVPLLGFGHGGLDSSEYNGDMLISSTRGGGPKIGLAQSLTDPKWKFGSYHKGVCQFAFCDGSVRPVQSGIPPDILCLLLAINDGQVIPPY